MNSAALCFVSFYNYNFFDQYLKVIRNKTIVWRQLYFPFFNSIAYQQIEIRLIGNLKREQLLIHTTVYYNNWFQIS